MQYENLTAPLSGALVDRVDVENPEIFDAASRIFVKIGLPTHVRGHRFLCFAIFFKVQGPANEITKSLYPAVAKSCGAAPAKVSHAIRRAISASWACGGREKLNEIFGKEVFSRDEHPTNGELIALLAEKVKMDMEMSHLERRREMRKQAEMARLERLDL